MGQGIDDFAKRMAEPSPEETPKIGRRSVLGRVALLFGGVGAGVLATDTPSFAATTCPPGLKLCSGKCQVITIDPDNCGACAHKCAGNQICRGGVCTTLDPTCATGQTWCGACVNTKTDPKNCGSCGTKCGAGKVCQGGVCKTAPQCSVPSDCPGTDTECGTRTCNAGVCGRNFVAQGTPVAVQIAGDCKSTVCDGMGGTFQVNNDADAPEADECFVGICTQGNPSLVPSAQGTPCSVGVCDGNGVCGP